MFGLVKLCAISLMLRVVNLTPLPNRPNIVIIQVDDMGSYDASYRGSNQFLTPNIDALAFNGIIMDRFYTPHMCTPSRSSVMTGKEPHKLGMQHWVILADEPWGLGLDNKLISNYFQDAGYATHLIGKWHLGHFQQKYTPTRRGFDTFYGYYNGLIDYWTFHYNQGPYQSGYDFRRNLDVNYDLKPGDYATDLFTNEALNIIQNHNDTKKSFFMMLNHLAPHTGNDGDYLQVPKQHVEKFSYIQNKDRQKLAAMIWKVDEGVGKVVSALEENGMLENTIILFYSDNGAPTIGRYGNGGSNHPLSGQKASPHEGATRNLGFIYSPLIKKNQRVHDGYFHTADVLPTLTSAAGIKIGAVDGFDQWNVLVNGGSSPRKQVINCLETVGKGYGIISDQWKFLQGAGHPKYLGTIEHFSIPDASYANSVLSSIVAMTIEDAQVSTEILTANKILHLRQKATISCNEKDNHIVPCQSSQKPCLFNIINDPCERKNVADDFPDILQKMIKLKDSLIAVAVPSRRKSGDKRCDPANFNGTWSWWIEDSEYRK